MPSGGVGGIAATEEYVVVGSRDPADRADLVECYRASTGQLVWGDLAPAPGTLDYGNSPRATPLVFDGFVFTVGALGDVHAIDLETGARIWETHFIKRLGGIMPDWGYSASPLIVNDQLILQPGGKDTALVGLDYITGEVLWRAKGNPPVYASLTVDSVERRAQLIGMDAQGTCGWNDQGQLLWRIKPRVPGDFGVPTPIVTSHGLVLTSENNGTRLYRLSEDQLPETDPSAEVPQANPNSYSPVVVENRLLLADDGLECFDLSDELQSLWRLKQRDMRGFATVIAAQDKVLMLTENGTLYLIGLETGAVIGKLKLIDEPIRILAAPALVGNRLYIRLDRELICMEL